MSRSLKFRLLPPSVRSRGRRDCHARGFTLIELPPFVDQEILLTTIAPSLRNPDATVDPLKNLET